MTIEVKEKIEMAKSEGKKIGLVQGSWDLFHLGHLRYIKKAKSLCDFLVIGMDSDEKIKKRKGPNRPIIPEQERYDFLKDLGIADAIVIKSVDEVKWGLIKEVRPDVLIAIAENYNEQQIVDLHEYCSDVAILPRQSQGSTSDLFRKIRISENKNMIADLDAKVFEAIESFKAKIGYSPDMPDPIGRMIGHMKDSTDWMVPVASACYYDGRWYLGANHVDFNLSKYDLDNRTELFYDTVEHAEINMLKKMGEIKTLDSPVWTTLFPCDECMKVLADKGVKKIFYLDDHPERGWSKKSHEIANKKNIEVINPLQPILNESNADNLTDYRYIYPPNARKQDQLDIMMNLENNGQDPLDPNIIDQPIKFKTNFWYVSENRFPYEGVEKQFLIVSALPIYNIKDISKEMWDDLKDIWLRLNVEYSFLGGAFCFRFGDPAMSGASLKRLHAHIIMPKPENKVKFGIGGHQELAPGLVLKKKE